MKNFLCAQWKSYNIHGRACCLYLFSEVSTISSEDGSSSSAGGLLKWGRHAIMVKNTILCPWVRVPTAGSCFVKGAASFTRMTNKNLREAPITKQVHSSKLNTSLIVSFPLKSQPHYSYDLQSLLSRSLNKQKTDSREPGEKQDQDTGDLFFISTSLTKYSIQVLFCGFCKEGRLLLLARRKGELVLFQVLIASSGSYDIVLHVLQARVRISCDDNIVIQLSHQFQNIVKISFNFCVIRRRHVFPFSRHLQSIQLLGKLLDGFAVKFWRFSFFLLLWLDFRELRKMDFSETIEWWWQCWSLSHQFCWIRILQPNNYHQLYWATLLFWWALIIIYIWSQWFH